MKKTIITASLCAITAMATAQETYESAQLATEDLNGTARYIGMGGAMEALGADISTINSNPAGIGMFRKSWAGLSGGVTMQSGNTYTGTTDKDGKTNADFNQAGFVYSTQTNRASWFNLAFNYHKSRNFNQILNAVGSLYNASANKLGYISVNNINPSNADEKEWLNNGYDTRLDYVTDMDYYNNSVVGNVLGGYSAANGYVGQYDNNGYIANFNFNFSGNIRNRVFLGVSIGLKSVNYDNSNYYWEQLVDINDAPRGDYRVIDERSIEGTGFDLKFGAIFLPIEDSPFRVGLYLHTPTWYDLTCDINTRVASAITDIAAEPVRTSVSAPPFQYDYKVTTPWKFGLSLGHTFSNIVALGATYEYADYSTIKNKQVYSDYYADYSDDYEMNHNTKDCLKGVHTAKVGVEVKPVPEVALRLGYNYVSPIYKNDAGKDFTIDNQYSIGNKVTTYDYTNWKGTNRVTFGLGFTLTKNLNLDLAYQYSTQKGEYHPFQSIDNAETFILTPGVAEYTTAYETNIGTPTSVKNNRHQINATLGYRF